MRTEQEPVISGPAACGSIAVANAIGVKAISCHGAKNGPATAARSSNHVAPSERWRQWRASGKYVDPSRFKIVELSIVAIPVSAGALSGDADSFSRAPLESGH